MLPNVIGKGKMIWFCFPIVLRQVPAKSHILGDMERACSGFWGFLIWHVR
jgi:hypothetical protein